MTPPQAWVNRRPWRACGNVAKKCSEQPRERLVVAVEAVRHLVAEVVDGVVPPEDAVVRREPVVVELVARVGEPLTPLPADRRGAGRLSTAR